jgi:hypothetical protein
VKVRLVLAVIAITGDQVTVCAPAVIVKTSALDCALAYVAVAAAEATTVQVPVPV